MKSTVFLSSGSSRQAPFLFLIIVIFLLLLAACGPAKKYAGPYLPDEEIAVIQPDDKMFTHINIISVGKNRLATNENGIAVLPGTHTLFLEVVLDYPFLDKYLYFNQYLTFTAEAGHHYTLHASILPMRDEGFTWITTDRDPEKFIVKKYALGLIPLSTYP